MKGISIFFQLKIFHLSWVLSAEWGKWCLTRSLTDMTLSTNLVCGNWWGNCVFQMTVLYSIWVIGFGFLNSIWLWGIWGILTAKPNRKFTDFWYGFFGWTKNIPKIVEKHWTKLENYEKTLKKIQTLVKHWKKTLENIRKKNIRWENIKKTLKRIEKNRKTLEKHWKNIE